MTRFGYPVSLDVGGKRAVVVGDARGKADALRAAGAEVSEISLREFGPKALDGAFVCVASSGDPAEREVREPRLDGRVAEDVLHVERDVEEERQESRERDELGHVREAEPVDPEDRQRRERCRLSALVGDEGREDHHGADQHADRLRTAPTLDRRAHEPVDEQKHPARDERGAEGVEVHKPPPRAVALDQPKDRREQKRAGDRVDEHHPAPAGALD